jgi:general secretion pathway protein G
MQRTHTPTTAAGFTLIEILVVMAIIGMLAVMVAPNIFNQQAGAQRDAALSQISALEAALDTYRLDVGQYPDSLEGLVENDSGRAAWNGPYLRREVPLDPWGNEYVYDSDGRGFTLVSYGPDGDRGGEGDDADIGL